MLLFTLLLLILAIVLFPESIIKDYYIKLTCLTLILAGILIVNTFNIHTVGSGISIYSGFFQTTNVSQSFDVFLFFTGGLAALPWPTNNTKPLFFALSQNIQSLRDNYLINFIYTGIQDKLNNVKNTLFNNFPLPSNFSAPINEFSLFLLFTIMGGSLLISCYDLIAVYLSIELQSFGVYLLSALYREKETSISAALKYYLLGSLSSCFILLGGVFIYVYTGLTQFDALYSFISVTGDHMLFLSYIYNYNLSFEQSLFSSFSIGIGIIFGIVLLLCGFLFKISAAPFHSWAPDVYDGTPTIVTTWLTILPKLAIFIFLIEFMSGISISLNALILSTNDIIFSKYLPLLMMKINMTTFLFLNYLNSINNFWVSTIKSLNVIQNLIVISALLSLIIGTVIGLSQLRIKRLFAFSTISHVGFLLLVLSLNTGSSVQSFVFYIFQYSLTNLDVFYILLIFGYLLYQKGTAIHRSILKSLGFENKVLFSDVIYIEDLKGVFYLYPLLSLSFTICLFSMAGTPPLIGFFAKQQLLYSTLYSGLFFLSFIAILVSVVSASYYLKVIKVLCFSSEGLDKKFDLVHDNRDLKIYVDYQADHKKFLYWIINYFSSFIGNYHSFCISFLTLFFLFFIFKSSLLLNSAQLLAESTIFL